MEVSGFKKVWKTFPDVFCPFPPAASPKEKMAQHRPSCPYIGPCGNSLAFRNGLICIYLCRGRILIRPVVAYLRDTWYNPCGGLMNIDPEKEHFL